MMNAERPIPRLMLVTDRRNTGHALIDLVVEAVRGGVDIVQIREKDLSRTELLDLTRAVVKKVGDSAKIQVNTEVQIAITCGTGVHLPEVEQIDAEHLRAKLASGTLIGRSVHSAESAQQSNGFDYVIAGPFAPTRSKPGSLPLGVAGLSEIVRAAPCPVFAIGGIDLDNLQKAIKAGVHGVAVMSLLGKSSDPRRTAKSLREKLGE